jgi:diaminopimelate decarboxylase
VANSLAPAWLTTPADANALAPLVWSEHVARNAAGEIEIAGVTASALVAEFGSPLYVFDEADARHRAECIRKSLDRACAAVCTHGHVYYASKAFLSGAVAGWMVDAGLRVDVASFGELQLALAAGVPAARIGLHGNNKSDDELALATRVGVGSLVIDSADEVARVAAAAAANGSVQPVRLRVNTGVHASTHEHLATAREDQKFGVSMADASAIVADIRRHDSLQFLGLHSHIGSQIFGSSGFVEAVDRLLAVHEDLLADGPVPELNIGGGFGIAYTSADEPADVPALVATLVEEIANQSARRGIAVPAIAIEPGRSIIGTAGMTLYTAGTIKPVEVTGDDGSTATRTYVSVDGGMSDNMRTALYQAEYTVALANRSSDVEPMLVRVVGKHCESGDIVVRHDYLPGDVHAGDILAVATTGAYCHSLANNYNALLRPAVVAVRDGVANLIVRRETLADLFSRDTQLEGAPR